MAASSQLPPMPPPDRPDALLEDLSARGSRSKPGSDSLPDIAPSKDPQASEDSAPADADPWRVARELQEADAVVEAYVSGHNKGGLLVRWRGLQGFVPASQLVGLSRMHVKEERMAQLRARAGELLQLKIIEVEADKHRLIFSERATEVTATERDDLLEELSAGQQRVGVITNLADFGAFVDLGGVEGLVHISELSWRRLTHPGDVVRPGQKIRVLVMDVDVEHGRVALSRKKLRRDPWIGVEERYHPGQVVSGQVTNLADFGAFVLLEEGLEGLLHVSELSAADGEESLQALETVSKGATIQAQVIYVSERKRRLALSRADG